MADGRREMSRSTILAFRRRTDQLDARVERSATSLRSAAWAGCQDSVPRAAMLSLHARVRGITPDVLDDPLLAQIWGPGFSAYVVPVADIGVFTLGRLPERGSRRDAAFEMAALLDSVLGDQPGAYSDIGKELGVQPNRLRYAALTGTVLLHWAGSGKPQISRCAPPEIEAPIARAELVRRFLHIYGPATSEDFARWAGVSARFARHEFETLAAELIDVPTPIGTASLLEADAGIAWQSEAQESESTPAVVRLLPSGDAYYSLRGPQRRLLVPDDVRRGELWPARVWPGAVLLDGEVVGTWRRSGADFAITSWRPFTESERTLIEAEASLLPLHDQPLVVTWS